MVNGQPQVGVGAIVLHHGRILLVRRAKEPNQGLWSIPGGRLRLGEKLHEAAEREILEETGIRIRVGKLLYHFEFIAHGDDDMVAYHYVVLDFAGDYLGGELQAGDDAIEAAWVGFDTLPELSLTVSTRDCLHKLYPQRVIN